MYEPFEQAIEMFQPHPEHTVSAEVYESRLSHCDECHGREELRCSVNPKCKTCSLVRKAQLINFQCPWGRWE